MGKKRSTLITSIAIIALCAMVITGTTWALFETEQTQTIVVSSASVAVDAYIDTEKLSSENGTVDPETGVVTFPNGGTASVNKDGELVMTGITPGDSITFDIKLSNAGDIPVDYEIEIAKGDKNNELAKAMEVTYKIIDPATDQETDAHLTHNESAIVKVTVTFPAGKAGVDYDALQGIKDNKINVIVKAQQVSEEG